MSSNDNDSDVMDRSGRGSHSSGSGGKMSMMQMLWADLRKRPVPSDPSSDELAYIEEEEAIRQQQSEILARAHSMSQAHVDHMARRYGA